MFSLLFTKENDTGCHHLRAHDTSVTARSDFQRIDFVCRVLEGESKLRICQSVFLELSLVSEKHDPVPVVLDSRQLAAFDCA